ncbi:hypothetical protein T484DRAFT_1809807, partial [Baffinella frigidus]
WYNATADAVVFESSPKAAGTQVAVEVSYNGGARWVQAGTNFAYRLPPVPASLHPSIGILSGDTVVTVIGKDFSAEAASSCHFGAAEFARAFAIQDATTAVRCASPPYTFNRKVQVSVSSNLQDFVDASDPALAFHYYDPHPVYRVTPTLGAFTGGSLVTFTGFNLNSSDPALAFHYYNPHPVYHVTPTLGAFTGGSLVTFTGRDSVKDFLLSPEARCRFGNQAVPGTVTGSSIVCATPAVKVFGVAQTGATVSMAVALDARNDNGTDTNGNCTFVYYAPISASCKFGNVAVFLAVTSPTTGTCVTPAHAAAQVTFEVSMNSEDYISLPTGFVFYSPVTMSKYLPRGVPIAGGSIVTLILSKYLPHGVPIAGGSIITVKGTNFRAFGAISTVC